MIVFTATGRCAKIKADEPITTGSVGMPVSVVLSGDFDGLTATMVFACGEQSADVALMGQEVTVPSQVLEEAGRVLEIGVYGALADGTIVIPTVWAKAGIVREGVLPSGVDPAEPTPSWVAQVQQWAEDAHDTAEQLAQDVASWEAEIDTAIDDARDATQDATQTAASIAQAESSRVTAEQARTTAESSRAAAESARVTAEASRATAEQTRAAAESSRTTAEQGRVTAETARTTAESARATAEQGRVTAEQSRATAETARASAESGRVTAEQGRASAENARTSAESARASAESARASAETSRITAESARATAESARASEWATIKAEAEDATSAAETATSDAQDATADATAAAAEARAASAATWLSGNVLFGELEEAAVLTADDVYSAPPKGVDVYGKSTQIVTTGKNLFDKNGPNGYWSDEDGSFIDSSLRVWWSVPVSEGDIIRTSAVGVWRSQTYLNGEFVAGGIFAQGSSGYVIPAGVDEIRGSIANNGYDTGLVTKNNADLSYEPYTGGKAAPNPDYPQSIESVDDLTLHVCGKNLFNLNGEYDANKYYNSTGARNNNNGWGVFYIPCIAGNSYTLSGMNVENATRIVLVSARGETGRVIGIGNTVLTAITVTPDTDGLLAINLRISGGNTELDNNIQLELGTAATDYAPYVGQSVEIPLSNHIARSLPNGTRDTLTLTYIGPSTEHEGWGVYSAELVQRVGAATYDGSSDESWNANNVPFVPLGVDAVNAIGLCDHAMQSSATGVGTFNIYKSSIYPSRFYFNIAGSGAMTVEQVKAWLAENPTTVLFKLVEPVTHDLGTIELPVNPAPYLTAWADGGSAQPTLALEYERALSIVIPRIEAAISDLATS